ncbi:MAG: hypothetical protein C4524_08195 [Candidatus Zixiibacteriota bacterium]|nr:MAG: hypothetical protein C4524_08195 [candidate division Zixibacteria bacterium]
MSRFPRILLLAALPLLASCQGERGPAGPAAESRPFITGAITCRSGQAEGTAVLQVDGPLIRPGVWINGTPLEPSYAEEVGVEYTFRDGVPLSPGDSARLEVAAPDTAWADLVMPGAFALLDPDPLDTLRLRLGQDGLAARWSRAPGADLYRLSLDLNYAVICTTEWGIIYGLYYWTILDTLASDTAIVFSAAQLFPDPEAAAGFDLSSGELTVTAQSGPSQPGQPGNVHGAGLGFVYGLTCGDTLRLEVTEE